MVIGQWDDGYVIAPSGLAIGLVGSTSLRAANHRSIGTGKSWGREVDYLPFSLSIFFMEFTFEIVT